MKRGTVLIMAGGTGGHVFPGARGCARAARARLRAGVARHAARPGSEARAAAAHRDRMDQRERRCAARASRRWLAAPFKLSLRDLAEPAGDATSQARRRARRGRIRLGSGRRRRVADAPAARDPRAERGRRHDQSHARASRAPRARSVSRELSAGRARRARRQSGATRDRCARRARAALRGAQRAAARARHRRQSGRGAPQRRRAGGARDDRCRVAADRDSSGGRAASRAGAELYAKHGVQADVRAFIDDMAEAYGWADLVVCRSGALTVSELAAAGLPAIFVPFAAAVDDHQTLNAKFLVDAQARRVDRRSAS